MPIYEYECKKCRSHIEVLQKMTDKPLTKCEKCGGRLEKQWSATGFQFVGSGWYVTDYAGKKTEAKEEKKTDAADKSAPSTDKSTAAKDGKPAKAAPSQTASSGKTSGD